MVRVDSFGNWWVFACVVWSVSGLWRKYAVKLRAGVEHMRCFTWARSCSPTEARLCKCLRLLYRHHCRALAPCVHNECGTLHGSLVTLAWFPDLDSAVKKNERSVRLAEGMRFCLPRWRTDQNGGSVDRCSETGNSALASVESVIWLFIEIVMRLRRPLSQCCLDGVCYSVAAVVDVAHRFTEQSISLSIAPLESEMQPTDIPKSQSSRHSSSNPQRKTSHLLQRSSSVTRCTVQTRLPSAVPPNRRTVL